MNNLDFTLLELKDITGEERLSIFEKYGTRAAVTDFAILLGSGVSDNYYTKEGEYLKNRTGVYYTKTCAGNNGTYGFTKDGGYKWFFVTARDTSVRLAIPSSSIICECSNSRINNLDVYEVEYGEYPQTVESVEVSNVLENLYNENKLQQMGKEYTTDSVEYDERNKSFKERKHIEYEYNGEKYIRILGDLRSECRKISDGRIVEEGKPYWVKVEPIVWLIDKERDVAVNKKLLFAGVQFNNERNYTGDFNLTNMYYFLNNYFAKDIVPFKIEKPKLYIVNFSDEKEKYYPAYEVEDILREFYTNIELIPEDANYFKEDALIYNSKKEVDEVEYYPYIKNNIEIDTEEYSNYLFELSVSGKNESIYTLYEKEYRKKQVNERLSAQVMKLLMK